MKVILQVHRAWVAYILDNQDTMTDDEMAEALHSTVRMSVAVMRRLYGLKRPALRFK